MSMISMFVVSNMRLPNVVFIFEGLSSFALRNRDFVGIFVISYRFQVSVHKTCRDTSAWHYIIRYSGFALRAIQLLIKTSEKATTFWNRPTAVVNSYCASMIPLR